MQGLRSSPPTRNTVCFLVSECWSCLLRDVPSSRKVAEVHECLFGPRRFVSCAQTERKCVARKGGGEGFGSIDTLLTNKDNADDRRGNSEHNQKEIRTGLTGFDDCSLCFGTIRLVIGNCIRQLPNEKTGGIGQHLGLELTSSGVWRLDLITIPSLRPSTTITNHSPLARYSAWLALVEDMTMTCVSVSSQHG